MAELCPSDDEGWNLEPPEPAQRRGQRAAPPALSDDEEDRPLSLRPAAARKTRTVRTKVKLLPAKPGPARGELNDEICAVCMEDDLQKDTCFIGCGHMAVCVNCARRLVQEHNNGSVVPGGEAKCPICRVISVPIPVTVA